MNVITLVIILQRDKERYISLLKRAIEKIHKYKNLNFLYVAILESLDFLLLDTPAERCF